MNFNDKASIYEQISISQKQAANKLFSLIDIDKSSNVIDVGCGTGYLTSLIKTKTDQVKGIDISPKMIEAAKKERPNINFYVEDGESLVAPDDYNLIITNAVTYYFKNVQSTFKNFYLSLKQNGIYALQAQTEVTPQFMIALNDLLLDEYTKGFYKDFKLPILQLSKVEFENKLLDIGFSIKHSELINFNNSYTLDEAMAIFKSGTATPLLNQAGYSKPITQEYIKKFWVILENGLKKQEKNGKISLDVPRCFILAKK